MDKGAGCGRVLGMLNGVMPKIAVGICPVKACCGMIVWGIYTRRRVDMSVEEMGTASGSAKGYEEITLQTQVNVYFAWLLLVRFQGVLELGLTLLVIGSN